MTKIYDGNKCEYHQILESWNSNIINTKEPVSFSFFFSWSMRSQNIFVLNGLRPVCRLATCPSLSHVNAFHSYMWVGSTVQNLFAFRTIKTGSIPPWVTHCMAAFNQLRHLPWASDLQACLRPWLNGSKVLFRKITKMTMNEQID